MALHEASASKKAIQRAVNITMWPVTMQLTLRRPAASP